MKSAYRTSSLSRLVACTLALLLPAATLHASDTTGVPALMPLPASVTAQEGRFVPKGTLRIAFTGATPDRAALLKLAGDTLRQAWHRPVVVVGAHAHADVRITLAQDGTNPEGYALDVARDGIALRASGDAGLFYGLQTLRQLAPPDSDPKLGIAAVRINDQPRFGYRGVMLDSARHMQSVASIHQLIDLMARYKFNTLHWHITDDQGWRLEIKRYPELTSIGGWRKETVGYNREQKTFVGDGTPYGGFYTQAQAREIVAYAKARHIQVIPEIDMPGHMVAAITAYPQLACTPGPFEVRTTWGVADDILCPSEQTFDFLKNVLSEVMAIFPAREIHLGGDEAPTTRWKQSALVQDIIHREGLKDEHAVQGWFLRRVENFVESHGRRIIGWDEILDGDPSRSAIVMSWRGESGGIRAAQRGQDVIMSPTGYSYFDYCQARGGDEPYCPGSLPLKQVYRFEPVPRELTPAEATHILGGQANLWTEHISNDASVQYMLWPRLLAMSEAVWSPRDARDWTDFNRRLGPQLAQLDRLNVNYRIPDVEGLDGPVATLDAQTTLALTAPAIPGAHIVYTTDGNVPDARSTVYSQPLTLSPTATPTQVGARLLLADGRLGPVRRSSIVRTELMPAQAIDAASLSPGLQRAYFELAMERTTPLLSATPLRSDIANVIEIPTDARAEQFGLRYQGDLVVPANDVYRFVLGSDDGAQLYIDGKLVVDRDGLQSPGDTSADVALARGVHRIDLRYFQGGGDRLLQLKLGRTGQTPAVIPPAWLRH